MGNNCQAGPGRRVDCIQLWWIAHCHFIPEPLNWLDRRPVAASFRHHLNEIRCLHVPMDGSPDRPIGPFWANEPLTPPMGIPKKGAVNNGCGRQILTRIGEEPR